VTNPVFVSVLELHGEYNDSKEFTTSSASTIHRLERSSENGNDLIRIETRSGNQVLVAISYDPDPDRKHELRVDGRRLEWSGFYHVFNEGG
jgi:hypothetical protein